MNPNLSRRSALSLTVSSLLTFTACATIPTNGEVNHYADPQARGKASTSGSSPEGPAPGARPTEIIAGFLHAGVGVADDYSVARLYLTEDLAQSWRPDGRTLVYDSAFTTASITDSTYQVAVPASTLVDNRGLATSYTTVADTDIEFTLRQVDGEWRISSAPDGTVLNRAEFTEVFSPFTLYFYDPTYTYAVPDIRWFAERSTVATSLVRVLLEGPAPYLVGAVASAVPADTRLTRNSVPIDGGVADVRLSGGNALSTASALEVERLRTQLTQTLTALASVTTVQLTIDDQIVGASTLENYREPAVNSEVARNIVGIEENRLITRATLDDAASQQTIVETSAPALITLPAMNYTRNYYAFTNTGQDEIWLASSNGARSVYRGTHVLAPCFDHQNWLWVGEQDGSVRVIAAGQEDRTPHTIASWLSGELLHSISIARDGTRAVLVTSSAHGNSYGAWVCAIRRAADGTPEQLLAPVRLGAEMSPRGAEWVSDVEVFLWNGETAQTELVSLTGENTQYDSLQGVTRIVTGRGLDQVVAMTGDGGLYTVAGLSWTRSESSLSQINYSG
ncbi:LpqB family beta-propeller domain-containing protein [Rothia sp. 88186D007BW]